MSPVLRRTRDAASVLLASLAAWYSLSTALQTPEPATRGMLLAIPPAALAWVAFPELARRWWARIAVTTAVWMLALYGSQKLYYPLGGASPACALSGLLAGASLAVVSLLAGPPTLSRSRWVFLACGALWVAGGALIGHGIELNLEHPMIQRKPGSPFLFAGVLVWFLPFALFRLSARDPRSN